VQRLVDENHDFKVDSLPHGQPVKLPQHRRSVLSSTSSSDQPSCRILYRLKALDQTVGDAAQKSVTVVQCFDAVGSATGRLPVCYGNSLGSSLGLGITN